MQTNNETNLEPNTEAIKKESTQQKTKQTPGQPAGQTKGQEYMRPRTREEIIEMMVSTEENRKIWYVLSPEAQEEIIRIYSLENMLKLTYDRVFRSIFDPEVHPKRLEDLLSQILGRKVTIVRAIPVEKNNYHMRSKRIYLDILVQFDDGSLANIEMQCIGCLFPNTRSAVYSASLITNQYNSLIGKYYEATGGADEKVTDDIIDYSKIHKVYTIALMEYSTKEFHKHPETYIHRSHQVFDSGIDMDMLQEYIYVALDIFKTLVDDPQNELEAWLAFLAADTIQQVDRVIAKFPYFKNLKDDVILYGEQNPREVIDLYLEGIEILDRNAIINEKKRNLEELNQLKNEITEKKNALAEKDNALAEKENVIAEKENVIAEKDNALAEKEAEIARLKALLDSKEKAI